MNLRSKRKSKTDGENQQFQWATSLIQIFYEGIMD